MKAKRELVVVGCGGHARFILGIIRLLDFNACGLIDLGSGWDKSEIIMDVPVVGCIDSIHHQYSLGIKNVVLGVGDNCLRERVFISLKDTGFTFPNVIHPSATIDSSARLGIGNVIGPNVVIGAEVKLGSNNIINTGAVIEHQCSIGDHNHLSLNCTICGNVLIKNNVFLGAGSTVVNQLTISSHTILGAGGTLVSSIEKDGLTMVGCPAREIRK